MINRIKLQLILTIFWFASAYLAIGAVLPWRWAWYCGWFNVIIGLFALLLVTQTKQGDRLFYKGPKGDEPGSLGVLILWLIPTAMFSLAIVWWFLRLIGIYDW